MEEKIKEGKMCMDFRYKYIEIKVVMVSGEVHIIRQRFALDSGVEEIINFLTRDKYIYTYEGAWINSDLIEEFNYTILNINMKKYRCDTECVMDYKLEDNMICCYCCPNRLDCAESCDSESCYIIRKIAIDKGEY